MRQKLDYIHRNPVEHGYVDLPEHWRYSSARNYAGLEGVIEVVREAEASEGRGPKRELGSRRNRLSNLARSVRRQDSPFVTVTPD